MKQAEWIIDQLVKQGVTQFCIAPGSRSAPLAIAAASHPDANITVHYDERGLGFYALGYGKGSLSSAAVITTSGTAVANLLPSVMEAFHSSTPLILLTADRPHELRESGSNQTTDQVKLFSNVIRFQMDLSPHLDEKSIHSIVAQSVFHALQNPPGPVHLNCPMYEKTGEDSPFFQGGKTIPFAFPELTAPPLLLPQKKGVILLGPSPSDPTPVLALAKRLQWPIFADLLSQARATPTPEQIRHFDYILRTNSELQPDCILHFGHRLISKHVLTWAKGTPLLHISRSPLWQDPSRCVAMRIQSDIRPFCETFQANTDPSWLSSWKELDEQMDLIIREHFDTHAFTEAHAIRNLPSDRPIFFGNSMPIRDADHFLFPAQPTRFFANRGVAGIDGNIATAAGIAEALQSSLLVFLGDQTALHDLNSLPLIKKRRLLLIISNNFGGGIFDHLPVSQSPFLETLFTAKHTWHFEHAAKMFDIPYIRKEKTCGELPPFGIVELITDRKENHRFQKTLLETMESINKPIHHS